MSAKELILGIVRRTNNPMAPMVLQMLMDGLEAAKSSGIFTNETTKEKANDMMQRLLQDFPDEELDNAGVASSPEFIVALCVMLKRSLNGYVMASK